MKNKQNAIEFEIKKKIYLSPQLQKYGTFSEYTKAQSGGQFGVDNQNYYAGDNPTS